MDALQIATSKASFVFFLQSLYTKKTNIEPENGPLEDDIPFGNQHFQVPC